MKRYFLRLLATRNYKLKKTYNNEKDYFNTVYCRCFYFLQRA